MSRGWLFGLTGLVVWIGLQTQVLAETQGISLSSAERMEGSLRILIEYSISFIQMHHMIKQRAAVRPQTQVMG